MVSLTWTMSLFPNKRQKPNNCPCIHGGASLSSTILFLSLTILLSVSYFFVFVFVFFAYGTDFHAKVSPKLQKETLLFHHHVHCAEWKFYLYHFAMTVEAIVLGGPGISLSYFAKVPAWPWLLVRAWSILISNVALWVRGGSGRLVPAHQCCLLKTVRHKDLLYSTRNYTQYLVMTYNGKEFF